MSYKNLPLFTKDFCREPTIAALKYFQKGASFNLVALTGVGITYFINHLQTRSKDHFVYINTFEMPDFTKPAFYRQMIIKLGGSYTVNGQDDIQYIKQLITQHTERTKRKLVIVFNRFDRLNRIADQSFFDNLRFLQSDTKGSVVMLFVSSEPLVEEFRSIKDISQLFSATLFFRPYSFDDLTQILLSDGTTIPEQSVISLSGGHHNLYNIISRAQSLDNPLSDAMVELIIKDLYFGQNPRRREELNAVSRGKKIKPDEYLVGVGLVKKVNTSFETFTPLLSEYIIEQSQQTLPNMENKLFQLLRRYEGSAVSKETIFDEVWQQQDGIASDWSLNSLVYRLRKHPAFDGKRYVIKSHKKIGYVLHDTFKR